jgi:hypothetical protein
MTGQPKERGDEVLWFRTVHGPMWSMEDPVSVEMRGEFIGLVHGIFRSFFVVRMPLGDVVQVPISKARLLRAREAK